MSEQNDFIIIDEKPKRDQRKPKPKRLIRIGRYAARVGIVVLLIIAVVLIYLTINPPTDYRLDDPRLTPLAATAQRRWELTQTPIQQTASALGLDYNEYVVTLIIEGATQTMSAMLQATETARAITTATPQGTHAASTPSIGVTSAP